MASSTLFAQFMPSFCSCEDQLRFAVMGTQRGSDAKLLKIQLSLGLWLVSLPLSSFLFLYFVLLSAVHPSAIFPAPTSCPPPTSLQKPVHPIPMLSPAAFASLIMHTYDHPDPNEQFFPVFLKCTKKKVCF